MPLQVIVVGAGIAGLCAAVALRQAGHSVKILEKSGFTAEAGAALLVTPNGERVLSRLGFDFARARADAMTRFEVLDGATLACLHAASTVAGAGASFYTVHRVDMHHELLRLAAGVDLQLAAAAVAADPDRGVVLTQDGARHHADLIVAADGLHSALRGSVTGESSTSGPKPSGMSAFRFMISTSLLENDVHFRQLMTVKGQGNTVLADTTTRTERHMVWYTCRDGQVQNFAGVHETTPKEGDCDLKRTMLQEFGGFHPSVRHIVSAAPEVSIWPLSYHAPLPSWHRGKLLLIGDAAHPWDEPQMLPFGAQGANQAIEDAGALGALLPSNVSVTDIPRRLVLFEKVRRLRASRVQTLSMVRLGKEIEVKDQVQQFADPPGSDVPRSFTERQMHDYNFDVFAAVDSVLSDAEGATPTQKGTEVFPI